MHPNIFYQAYFSLLTISNYMLLNSNMKADDSDLVWKALSDPTRRKLLDLLRNQPRTTGELSEAFANIGRCAVMKHLGILEEVGLVIVKREGKFRWNYINPIPIQKIYDRWMSQYAAGMAKNLLRLKQHIEEKG